MLAHERSLVKRLEGKPFVLLGVYVPQEPGERQLVKQQMARGIVTWRCWWDEKGTLAGRWGVETFPGIFVIDAKGVLRSIGLHGRTRAAVMRNLDATIEQLVAEAEKSSS
jgi:hypothetical protein